MNDADLIDALGGPTKVAALLDLRDPGAVQRVSNWKRRGIPPRVRLEHPRLLGAGAVIELIGAEGAPAVPVLATEASDAGT